VPQACGARNMLSRGRRGEGVKGGYDKRDEKKEDKRK
jgi:hypothetical protein